MVQHNPDPALADLVQQQWPTAPAAGYFFALPGLSGNSFQIAGGQETLLARRTPLQPIPFVNRQREYRILRQLRNAGLGPEPLSWRSPWLLQRWLPGEALTPAAFDAQRSAIVALVSTLHRQPLTGYPLRLLPLLQLYWQRCRQRHWRWLARLQRLQRQGEPRPLRLAPLHMDVHPGNVIATPAGLRLIDWEYAADGDVALELAAICAWAPAQAAAWTEEYAARTHMDAAVLARQIARWQPWLQLLMASWYQLRAEQSGEATLQQLAQTSWQDI
ncbi:thiamine kinase [Pantoea sp. UBA6567]|uniref:thiamine kinase n=1 Tax=Pantoea sp. UBA6567 TaxID=1947043 RepID=UPI00259A4D62|nr:thiamine kinase [Pantoea sp. UBA6567]